MIDLICENVGGKVIFASDEFFAAAQNLLSLKKPKFDPDSYTEYGKEMDGWETRRKRTIGHDFCIIKMGISGFIDHFCIDTAHFTGNHAPRVSIQGIYIRSECEVLKWLEHEWQNGSRIGKFASKAQFEQIDKIQSESWQMVLPFSLLGPGYDDTKLNVFQVEKSARGPFTHLRVNIFPDGGIARIKAFGQPFMHKSKFSDSKHHLLDLVSLKNGGSIIGSTNSHYGKPINLIMPGRGKVMGDGWETARRLDRPAILTVDERGFMNVTGKEWVIVRLGNLGKVSKILIDTNLFKGNFPESVEVEGTKVDQSGDIVESDLENCHWKILLIRSKVLGHCENIFEREIADIGPINVIKLTIFPDGGVMRLRVHGSLATQGTTFESKL